MDPGVHSDPQIGLQTRLLTSKLPRPGEPGSPSWAPGHDLRVGNRVSDFCPESAQTACYGLFGAQKPKGAFWGSGSPQTDPHGPIRAPARDRLFELREELETRDGPFVAQIRPFRANRQPFERSEAPLSAAGLEARSDNPKSTQKPKTSGPENDPRRAVLGL